MLLIILLSENQAGRLHYILPSLGDAFDNTILFWKSTRHFVLFCSVQYTLTILDIIFVRAYTDLLNYNVTQWWCAPTTLIKSQITFFVCKHPGCKYWCRHIKGILWDRRWSPLSIRIYYHTCWFLYGNALLIMKLSKLPSFKVIRALIASHSTFE